MNFSGGSVSIVGDKSISHRAVIFGALAEGVSKINNVLISGDTKATIQIFQNLGVNIKSLDQNTLEISGVGLNGLKQFDGELDAINSGTTARLLMGLLSKQNFSSKLTGSNQLKKRPMDRIIDPLVEQGAKIVSKDKYLPVEFQPSNFNFDVVKTNKPSAQVKSGLIIASLYNKENSSTIIEDIPTRDHTERLLGYMGVDLIRMGNQVTISPNASLSPVNLTVPGDPSSAAFLIAVGLLSCEKIIINNLLLNERRIGFLKIIKKMGGNISIDNIQKINNENVGDVIILKSNLNGVSINKDEVVDMVDEFPIFTLLASQASGETTVVGAEELRVKESDRIAAMEKFILNLGGEIRTQKDGFKISGKQSLQAGTIESNDDHRIAMTAIVANVCINSKIEVDNIDCISDSYPSFFEDLLKIGVHYGN